MLSENDVIPFGHSLVERDQCQGSTVHSSEERRGHGKERSQSDFHGSAQYPREASEQEVRKRRLEPTRRNVVNLLNS